MPKMKTHRGAAKRIKLRKGGTLKRAKAFTSHILTKKSQKRKRNLRKVGTISSADIKRIRRALGI